MELAIAVPLLFLLVFGMMDFGLALHDYLAISQITREATRTAALGYDDATVRARASAWAVKLNLNPSDISLSGPTGTDTEHVSVTIAYPHKMISWRLLGMSGETLQLSSTMVMRKEAGSVPK